MRVKYPKRGGEIIPPVLTKIPQIMETSETIYNNHLEAFKNGTLQIDSISPKFKNAIEVKEHLTTGNILPVLFNKCAESTLSISMQILFYSLKNFPDKRLETKFKKAFISALNKLNIN